MAVITRGGILSYGADLIACLFLTVNATRSGLGLVLSALLSVQATTIPEILQSSAFEKARVPAFGDSDVRVWIDIELLFGADDVTVEIAPGIHDLPLAGFVDRPLPRGKIRAVRELPLVLARGNVKIES